MQKITPFIWYDKEAREAAKFYVSVFGGDSRIIGDTEVESTPSGIVDVVSVVLLGNEFTLMSAGPYHKFNESISFVVNCKDQEEVDKYWNALSAVKESEQCGWLKDKYGVSWQITPTRLIELISDPDKEKANRVTQAMLQMKKIDIALLEKAANKE